jgi:hypothetical protein
MNSVPRTADYKQPTTPDVRGPGLCILHFVFYTSEGWNSDAHNEHYITFYFALLYTPLFQYRRRSNAGCGKL